MTEVHQRPKKQEKEKGLPKSATSAAPVVRRSQRVEQIGPKHTHRKKGERLRNSSPGGASAVQLTRRYHFPTGAWVRTLAARRLVGRVIVWDALGWRRKLVPAGAQAQAPMARHLGQIEIGVELDQGGWSGAQVKSVWAARETIPGTSNKA
ncbi:hypothetical protein NDU88_001407 [Pleurodeles waltl]|uniref:Uncharacterized protein n=1 Tax=Pleurodeles waltl TaxID=8319 RepID=A0AAV7ND97_PLEWA|nr:hypothetical protein NDU88_001407 [Pleurodeles waltl]